MNVFPYGGAEKPPPPQIGLKVKQGLIFEQPETGVNYMMNKKIDTQLSGMKELSMDLVGYLIICMQITN